MDSTAWERAPFSGFAVRFAGMLHAHVEPCPGEDPADNGRAAQEDLCVFISTRCCCELGNDFDVETRM